MEVSKEREREVLLKRVEQIRRLLGTTFDERMTVGMKELLHELEEQLREMDPSSPRQAARSKEPRPRATWRGGEPTEHEVTRRAYELWEMAGHPEGRSEEFYNLAEQELRNANGVEGT